MMAGQQDIQMPLFGPASGQAAKITDWGDVDALDVDALAEYFLEEANTANTGVGMTFDFSIDNSSKQPSTVVSPENSEDGNMPLVGDAYATDTSAADQAPVAAPVAQQPQPQVAQPLACAVAPLAAPGVVAGGVVTPQIANLIAFQQMQQQHAMASATKRQRLDPAPTLIGGQNLAVAAAQALEQHSNRGRGRKSQAQIDRRRERNRILARRTRLRKKFFFESLQKEVLELQNENNRLKHIVKSQLDSETGEAVLASCQATEKLPPGVLEACGAKSDFASQDFNLVQSIRSSQHCFVITDPSLADNPIVFASDDFLSLTGYSREQVLGRNCRFLQGTGTRKESIEEIRTALSKGEDVTVTLINYTSDGTPFWNKLFIAALRDAQNSVVNFIGVTVRVATPEAGHPDHGKVFKSTTAEDPNTEDDADTKPESESTLLALEDSVSASLLASNTAP